MRSERPSRREGLPTGTDRTTRLWKRNLLITAVVALAAFLFFFFRGGGAMRAELGRDGLTVTPPGGGAWQVRYADIQVVTLAEQPDFGECLEGGQDDQCLYGRWRNDIWGEYRLCVHPDVPVCVCAQTADDLLVFNASSKNDTEWLASALSDKAGG